MRRFLLAAAAVSLVAVWLCGQITADVRRRGEKIVADLERLDAEQQRRPGGEIKYTLSEADLNAYIAYWLASEGEKYVKACEVRLLAGNRIEGKLVIELGGAGGLSLIPSRSDLLFSAGVTTEGGRIKINMDSLFLGTQRLSPTLIDVIIAVASKLEGVKPTSLSDWYALPYGIQRMETRPGRLILFYGSPENKSRRGGGKAMAGPDAPLDRSATRSLRPSLGQPEPPGLK
jgi:hypothetical protein